MEGIHFTYKYLRLHLLRLTNVLLDQFALQRLHGSFHFEQRADESEAIEKEVDSSINQGWMRRTKNAFALEIQGSN